MTNEEIKEEIDKQLNIIFPDGNIETKITETILGNELLIYYNEKPTLFMDLKEESIDFIKNKQKHVKERIICAYRD